MTRLPGRPPAVDLSEPRTERLVLRRWRESDREPFAVMNADPEVTRFLRPPLDRAGSDALVDRIEAGFERSGVGLWAVGLPAEAPFVGYVGLSEPGFVAPFTPAVEIGWRIARPYWGRGLAPEGAVEVLRVAFEVLDLDEVVSFTTVDNAASRRVMAKLGLTHDPADDFDHPALSPDDPLRPHVLYRISAARWRSRRGGTP